MTFTLQQLETFVWVSSLRNFRKTAKRMHTTQPAISLRITALEEALDVKLFERNTGSVNLTSKGQELLPYAEKIIQVVGDFRNISGSQNLMSGVLRLGVSETIVHTWLPKFLSKLHNVYPNINVEITVDVTANLRNELVGRMIDIAFLMGPVSEYRIENIKLPSFPLIWAASPNLEIDIRKSLKISELVRHPLLTYARNTRPFTEVDNFLRSHNKIPARIFPSSSLAACLRMTLDGIGIGTLPKMLIETQLKDGSLIEIPCSWQPSALNFTASYSSSANNLLSQAAAKLAHEVAME